MSEAPLRFARAAAGKGWRIQTPQGSQAAKGWSCKLPLRGSNSKRVISLPEIRMGLAKPFVRGAESSMRADGLRYLSWGGAWRGPCSGAEVHRGVENA